MSLAPSQIAIAAFEIGLLLAGVGLLFWVLTNPEIRLRWLGTNRLPVNGASAIEFTLLAVLVFLVGFALQAATQLGLGSRIEAMTDRQGLQVVLYSLANYLGAFIGWKLVFPSLRQTWLIDSGVPVQSAAPAPRLAWSKALRISVLALAATFPLLGLINLGWTFVIEKLGLPATQQDVVAIFANTKSPFVIIGLLLVACVLAPIYEELLFRAGLYRFCRHRLGRGWALVISGVSFGALHGYWTAFVPLSFLGMALALAYEATGSIRVPILFHALFNLNTVLILLSGLPQVSP